MAGALERDPGKMNETLKYLSGIVKITYSNAKKDNEKV